MKSKRIVLILFLSLIFLLIPFIAMQFTDEVDWNLADFVMAFILLSGTGLLCDLAVRRVSGIWYRIIICIVIIIVFLLIWAELAVGIFGTPFAGQ